MFGGCRLELKSVSYLIRIPFPNKPWFLRVWSSCLLKTLSEKEKLLVTSNFSFSHSVFYPSRELSAIFIKYKIVVCELFQFGRVYNLSFGAKSFENTVGKGEKSPKQTQVFTRVQAKSFENTIGKGEKSLITSNFSFSHSVSYSFGELSGIIILSEIVVSKLLRIGRV